ncbi:MAG: histidinol-phosphate transaminase [Candidatus Aminicenantes bacterium]|nr:histidinol-phosphate transaminase [Candidatus Aminicenantes bacterium]NIM82238.1 histidinol-phosphate transaminase [Candidatus Aminicenantes bacterium]NIN20651.1 histidinol-phosphate transaminase [Candidatus Aminicenantes bacterium]NIN44430.1 histidinol-phosphate transaminase [Candidatus Aminicenantes bacterium]NIN87249.1 histidinol-phosphate transaminase [Candidatus Aminicenantes bacterium]
MKDLVNPNVLELIPYKPGKPVEELRREHRLERIVKLASNENPFPVPQNVVDAVNREISHFNFYPENDSYYLRHRIAEYNGIDAENVIVGAGSVQLIRMIVSTFLKPGETVLTSQKTFLMYRISATEAGGKSAFIEAPMGRDYMYDMDALYDLVDDKTKIIFIANPNNPTGTMVPRQVMMDFITKIPDDKIIVLDNAYQEYVHHPEDYPDAKEEALNRKNLIVLRTFSKIYALAGLRVGYAVANDEVLAYLNRLKPPFNVTRAAQAAALASLENEDFKRWSASLNVENKAKLYQQLKEMGMEVIPSETNFLCFFPGVDTVELNQRLLKEGIIIRPLHAFGVPEGIRVTVGFEEDNDFFIEKLTKVLEEM